MIGWREICSEFLGTALLLLFGLSAIVINFSPNSPMISLAPSQDMRRLLTALLFSASATVIIYSPLGRISGGHINPVITLAFFRLGKLTPKGAGAYVLAQLGGAVTGTVTVALIWGHRASEVRLGATVPGRAGVWPALGAEAIATFLAISLILTFIERPRLMPFTAAAAGLLGAVLTYSTVRFSGASLNPARSAGPALVGGTWMSFWIYLLAPSVGALGAATLHRHHIIPCGKLFHDAAYACHFKNCLYNRHPEIYSPPSPRPE
ncbi:MIP/aquaporin family protein [Streptomyces sp. NPDC005227]|uniref:MIP/aquaporin family protein n=1 Tax=Streptomyces sp. NPDC005227 TaxID=3364707 RepID=UPI00369555CD